MTPELRVVDDLPAVAVESSDLFMWLAEDAVRRQGRCTVALSGGATPQALHARLAEVAAARLRVLPIEYFFGDERCVAPDDPESNYGMARTSLFRPAGIPDARIHRMPGEQGPDDGSRQYEAAVRQAFGEVPWPRFDLILLGLGDDGHTASLFPRAPQLAERHRLVVGATSPKGVKGRITFTVPLINAAHTVLFLVSGAGKAEAVSTVLDDAAADPQEYPAKLIQPSGGRLIWILDRAAARALKIMKQQIPSDEE